MKKCKVCKGSLGAEQINTMAGAFCCFKCAKKFCDIKAKKKKEKEFAERKRKVKLDNINHQKQLTQQSFNRMRVLEEKKWFADRGIEPYCISCGKVNMDWCCGHYKTVGSSSSLRYERANTYLQCNYYCNRNKSGNIAGCKNTRGYKKGLIYRFGEEKAAEIMAFCEETQYKPISWTGEELLQMRKIFNHNARQLKKELGL